MAEFEVKAVRIDEVTDHPNADRLSLNRIGGYIAISNKLEDGSHRYSAGDVVIYVPEGAVVPDYLLQRQGFWKDGKGLLAGSRGNRVKAIKLRGVLSQGLIVPGIRDYDEFNDAVENATEFRMLVEGEDYANFFGIVKYEPPIPANMTGDLISSTKTLKFDVENGQKYTDVFEPEDRVVVTEKLHGTFAAFVFTNEPQEGWIQVNDDVWATAYNKGLGARGLVFKDTEKNRASNLYVRALLDFIQFMENHDEIDMVVVDDADTVTFLGEIYGRGVQDLQYSAQTPQFAMFDVVAGSNYLDPIFLAFEEYISTVPVLWTGSWKDIDIESLRDGKSAVDNSTLREGIVVRAANSENRSDIIGRKMVKFVSPDYLTRKGGTELQ